MRGFMQEGIIIYRGSKFSIWGWCGQKVRCGWEGGGYIGCQCCILYSCFCLVGERFGQIGVGGRGFVSMCVCLFIFLVFYEEVQKVYLEQRIKEGKTCSCLKVRFWCIVVFWLRFFFYNWMDSYVIIIIGVYVFYCYLRQIGFLFRLNFFWN